MFQGPSSQNCCEECGFVKLEEAQSLQVASAEQTLVRVLMQRSKLHPPVTETPESLQAMDEVSRNRHIAAQACIELISSGKCGLFMLSRNNGEIRPRLRQQD